MRRRSRSHKLWVRTARLAALVVGIVALGAPAAHAAAQFEGTVWNDQNNDGQITPGEPPMPNVPVRLLRADGSFIRTTNTDVNGHYLLITANNSQAVQVEVMSGWFRSQCRYGVDIACPAGGNNDFPVANQRVLVDLPAPLQTNYVLDAGFVPDWGEPDVAYPGPAGPFNTVDPAIRASGILSACADFARRICGIGQVPRASVQVFNQGIVPLSDIEVTLTYDPSTEPLPTAFVVRDNPGLTLDVLQGFDAVGRQVRLRLTGSLPPGSAFTFEVPQKVVRGPLSTLPFSDGQKALWSKEFYAEVSALGGGATDVDATNDTNPLNDKSVGHDVNASTARDQDDHDDMGFNVASYDLALRVTPAVANLAAGSLTTATFTVFNQGNAPVDGVQVSAYVPEGMRVFGAVSEGWVDRGNGRWTTTIPGRIEVGANASASIGIVPDRAGTQTLTGEILTWADTGFPGLPITDFDSTPDTERNNDGPVTDDAILNENGDQDDHDVAVMTVAPGAGGGGGGGAGGSCTVSGSRADLALRITKASPARVASSLTFRVVVFNQGSKVANDIRVSDYLSVRSGLTFAPKLNPLWVRRSKGRVERRIAVLPAGKKVVIFLKVVPQRKLRDKIFRNVAEISSASDDCGGLMSDADSKLDLKPGNDRFRVDNAINNQRGDEDDSDWVRAKVNPRKR